MNIGIIGKGFVGTAVYEGLRDHHQVLVWDIDPAKCTVHSLDELVTKSSHIFICVPTPTRLDGSCDLSILHSVISDLSPLVNQDHLLIIKSTVPPGTTRELSGKIGCDIVFNPEFLTEANFISDFKNQDRIIVGVELRSRYTFKDDDWLESVAEVLQDEIRSIYCMFSPDIIHIVNYEEAELAKYVGNTFLALKVSYANQLYDLCDKAVLDYNEVIRLVSMDPRIGSSHFQVPGPDGDRGFGGSCFPKDLNALLNYSVEFDHNFSILEEAKKYNDDIRTLKNWTVSDENTA